MADFPCIKINNHNHDYSTELNNIFSTLLRYEDDFSEDLIEIRKKQILKHSHCSSLIRVFARLADLIGTKYDNNAEAIVEYLYEELKELHSPVYFHVPTNLEPFHKWESWTFSELYDQYIFLVNEKGWEDFYSLKDDFSKNKRETNFGMDFDIDYDLIKNYHIVDMLNDLIMNDIICGYDIQSFLNPYSDNVILKTFNKDSKIAIKTHKRISFDEYSWGMRVD